MSIIQQVKSLFESQLLHWPMAAEYYGSLQQVQTKEVLIDGMRFPVQFNPARKRSINAKTDQKSIQERPCFLCASNLPSEQEGIDIGNYTVLVNPFPIFPEHFTIPSKAHTPQRIEPYFGDFLDITALLNEWVVFYNGPACGASAPDHLHFQACTRGLIPLIEDYKTLPNEQRQQLRTTEHSTLFSLNQILRTVYVIEATKKEEAAKVFSDLYQSWQTTTNEEPLMNILATYTQGKWTVFVMPRKAFRPSCFYATDDSQLLISPAAVEMGGLMVTSREIDFQRVDADLIREIYTQITL